VDELLRSDTRPHEAADTADTHGRAMRARSRGPASRVISAYVVRVRAAPNRPWTRMPPGRAPRGGGHVAGGRTVTVSAVGAVQFSAGSSPGTPARQRTVRVDRKRLVFQKWARHPAPKYSSPSCFRSPGFSTASEFVSDARSRNGAMTL